jgi:FAR1 DNA-binding domain
MNNQNRTIKRPRDETRITCHVCLRLNMIKKIGKYIVTDFVAAHNHCLQGVEARHLIPSQRNVFQYQATTINLADVAGINPNEAYQLMAQ